MDTGTHLVVGLGLAGLAHVDPVIAGDPVAATAVLIGTVIGSQAPDFDQILRLKGNAAYIRNHRGWSHSLPALGLWTCGITACLAAIFSGIPLLHIGLWVFIAVSFHIFSDLFNTYGTQALRPFSQKWVSWNIIHIFDPFIFIIHVIGISLWAFSSLQPQHIFVAVYLFLLIYYGWRTVVHAVMERKLNKLDPDYEEGDSYTLIPTYQLNVWNVVKRKTSGTYVTGELKNGVLKWVDIIPQMQHSAIEASKKSEEIQALLHFSNYAAAEVEAHKYGYEVHWFDVRYRHRKQYPFVGVVLLDQNMHVIASYIGWVSATKLKKKLEPPIQV